MAIRRDSREELIQPEYGVLLSDVTSLIEEAGRNVARTINSAMTASYWLIGRRLVESEQSGVLRADYGDELVKRLSADLSARYGRGLSVRNLWHMRAFYLAWPSVLGEEIVQTVSAQSWLQRVKDHFRLPWSAYVRLLSVKNEKARCFYEAEAIRGGWLVRQLGRQINSQFYERTALSQDKAAMLQKG